MRLMLNKLANICKNVLDNTLFGQSQFRHNLQLLGPQFQPSLSSNDFEPKTVFDTALWFAAPKSKISPSRKKMKHLRMIPDEVNWVKCARCGESKLPSRMCTKNKEICVMREADYEIYKRNNPTPGATAAAENKA